MKRQRSETSMPSSESKSREKVIEEVGKKEENDTTSATTTTTTTTTNINNNKSIIISSNADTTTTTTNKEASIEIYVDVIIPMHNSSSTIKETINSIIEQDIPIETLTSFIDSNDEINCNYEYKLNVLISCYDDASTDATIDIVEDCVRTHYITNNNTKRETKYKDIVGSICIDILLTKSMGISYGAGYARNQAVHNAYKHRKDTTTNTNYYLCFVDSDDILSSNRISSQIFYFLSLTSYQTKIKLLLGCNFIRKPINATWHYTTWANTLDDKRLYLEKYREVTIIQPTWMVHRDRFIELGGYVTSIIDNNDDNNNNIYKLIHPKYDTNKTIRLAEDLRFFHAHLIHDGKLKLLHTTPPSIIYRHVNNNQSQSSQTSRLLLFQLRVKAFEDTILSSNNKWSTFIIWGAGRDGKLFLKSLSTDELRKRVICFVDVDEKKLKSKFYCNKDLNVKIPIVHFSHLSSSNNNNNQALQSLSSTSSDNNNESGKHNFGNINKKHDGNSEQVFDKVKAILNYNNNDNDDIIEHNLNINESYENNQQPFTVTTANATNTNNVYNEKGHTNGNNNKNKYPHNKELYQLLPSLPVVVCVAMYRTNGVLESNVMSIGRTEGDNLWFFS